MSDASAAVKPIRSPSYPNMPLSEAVDAIGKIERVYRSSPVDRLLAAKLIGYSSLSGPANKALAALASYGLLERAGKGEARVTTRARAILYADGDEEKRNNLLAAASEPDLFREIMERFPDHTVPPMEGVVTYLNRQGFNPNAVRPAAKAFLETMSFVEQLRASDSHGGEQSGEADSEVPDEDGGTAIKYGGAKVGDLVQWEAGGVLRLERPTRVRWVSDDGQWLAVDGSETGIPMNEVIVEGAAQLSVPPAPRIPPMGKAREEPEGEEWFRAKVGAGKQVVVYYEGEDEIGPKEIQKLIDMLGAQKLALED